MTRVFIAKRQQEARSALKLLLMDLKMQVVGEADNWSSAISEVAGTKPNMLLVDWDLIPKNTSLDSLMAF